MLIGPAPAVPKEFVIRIPQSIVFNFKFLFSKLFFRWPLGSEELNWNTFSKLFGIIDSKQFIFFVECSINYWKLLALETVPTCTFLESFQKHFICIRVTYLRNAWWFRRKILGISSSQISNCSEVYNINYLRKLCLNFRIKSSARGQPNAYKYFTRWAEIML